MAIVISLTDDEAAKIHTILDNRSEGGGVYAEAAKAVCSKIEKKYHDREERERKRKTK